MTFKLCCLLRLRLVSAQGALVGTSPLPAPTRPAPWSSSSLRCGPLSPPPLLLFLPKAGSGGGMSTCRAGLLFYLSSFPLPVTWGPPWGPPYRPSVARHTLLLLAECPCCYPLILGVGPTPIPRFTKTPGRRSVKSPSCSAEIAHALLSTWGPCPLVWGGVGLTYLAWVCWGQVHCIPPPPQTLCLLFLLSAMKMESYYSYKSVPLRLFVRC